MSSNSETNTASATTTADLVFRGKNYSLWRSRMENLLQRRDLSDVLFPSEEEEFYIDNYGQDTTRLTKKQKMYARRQAQAKNVLFDHLDTEFYRRVRFCPAARDVFDLLDEEFYARTNVGIVQARKAMTSFDYTGTIPLAQYLDEYQQKCEAYEDAGGALTEEDMVYQLQGALTLEFDDLIDWFESLPARRRKYNVFRAKVLEKGSRLQHGKRLPANNVLTSPMPSPAFSDSKSTSSLSNAKSAFNPRAWCPYCKRRGHSLKDCRSLQNSLQSKDQTPSAEEPKTPSPSDGSHSSNAKPPSAPQQQPAEQKHDWLKFKSLSLNKDFAKDKDQHDKKNDTKTSFGLVVRFSPADTDCLRRLCENSSSVTIHPANITTDATTPAPIELGPYDGCMLLDSGSEFHLTNDLADLINPIDPPKQFLVQGVDRASNLKAEKIGSMRVKFENTEGTARLVELDHVLYVPGLVTKLLSVYRIIEDDRFGVNFRRDMTKIYDTNSGDVVVSASNDNRLTWIRYSLIGGSKHRKAKAYPATVVYPSDELRTQTDPPDMVMLWHRRLGHTNAKYLKWSIQNTIGMPTLKIPDTALVNCPVCVQAKSTRLPHNRERTRPTRKLEILCSDICDAKSTAITGHKMFVIFIDIFSGFVELVPIKNKSEVPSEFAKYHKWLTNQFPEFPVASLRCDGAREYVLGDCKRYCDAAGIRIDSGCPFSPELNGTAERANRTIIEKIRVLLIDANLGVEYWPFAAYTAVYLINRLPNKNDENHRTPFEILHGRKPEITHLRVFGSIAMQHIPQQVRQREATQRRTIGLSKLGPVAKFAVLFGYTTTGYQVLEFDTYRTVVTRDVRFLETENIHSFKQKFITDSEQNTTTEPNLTPDALPLDVPSSSSTSHDRPTTVPFNASDIDSAGPSTSSLHDDAQPVPPDHIIEEADPSLTLRDVDLAIDVDSSLSQSLLDPVTRISAMIAGVNRRRHRIETTLGDFIPKSYNDAVSCRFADDWIAAMSCEFESHRLNETWSIVPRNQATNLLRTLWVYTTKTNTDGHEIAKARLVAFGCADQHQYAAKDTYAAVCSIEIIRLVFSLATIFGFEIIALDVTTAFLYGKLHIDMFITPPQGLDIDRSRYVLKLNKALYGLKVSSKLWHDTLKEALLNIGYIQSICERCLYYIRDGRNLAFLVTYVDDLLLVSNSDSLITHTLTALTDRFRIKINRSPTSFVGLEIHRDINTNILYLSQSRYIYRLQSQFNITEVRSYPTPLEPGSKQVKSSAPNDDREFRAYIGALLYVSRFSRPDISYAVHALSTCQGHVTDTIKGAARRVIRYLVETCHLQLRYTPNTNAPFWSAFVDAAHATEEGMRSVSGFLLFNQGNLVDWSARRQDIITMSSSACEIVAVASNLDAMLVPRALCFEIFRINAVVDMFEDNTSAIYALDGGQHTRLRWIMIKAAAAREAVSHGFLSIHQVTSANQWADIMTKPVDTQTFERIRNYLLYVPI